MNIQIQKNHIQDLVYMTKQWNHLPTNNNQIQYIHKYSSDICQVQYLSRIKMKQLDHYCQRQAYCLPFCPKIYKYTIINSQCIDSEMIFDIRLITQKVNNRWKRNKDQPKAINIIKQKLQDLIISLQYLFKRYGPFLVQPEMIGWTSLKILKVWFNSDFNSSQISTPLKNEQEMIEKIIIMLQQNKIIKSGKNIKSFKMLKQITRKQQTLQFFKPTKLNKLQLNNSFKSQSGFNGNNIRKTLTKFQYGKNITFSYSNNNIHDNKSIKQKQEYQDIVKMPSIVIVQNQKNAKNNTKILSNFYHNEQTNNSNLQNIKKSNNLIIKNTVKLNNLNQRLSINSQEQNLTPKAQRFQRISQGFNTKVYKIPILNENYNKKNIKKVATQKPQKPQKQQKILSTHENKQTQEIHLEKENIKDNTNKLSNFSKDSQIQNNVACNSKLLNLQNLRNTKRKSTLQIFNFNGDVQQDFNALFVSKHSFDCGQLQGELDSIL